MIPEPNNLVVGDKETLIGKTEQEFKMLLAEYKAKAYVASILYSWLYVKRATSFGQMTNLSLELRSKLEGEYSIRRPDLVRELLSEDGTRKWLLRLACGNTVETVFIPEGSRGTLCVSSQIGCTLNCSFCHTGTQRLKRNLSCAEIIAQVFLARDRISVSNLEVTNIVFMGMGEPLYNVENVFKSIKLMIDGRGLGFSKRKVTLSTSGIVPEIGRVGSELGVKLAVSLHSAKDSVRDKLVPINRKYNLSVLMDACRKYPSLSNSHRITWEYVMLKGVNDSLDDAKDLVRLISGIPSKINLIPYNPWPGSWYECSDDRTLERFRDYILRAGYASLVRRARGQDIMAACGQLNSEVGANELLTVE